MGFFARFRRGVRKSISSLSMHSSPPSSPQTAPDPVLQAPSSPTASHKPLPKMLSWSSSDRPTTSTSSTNAFAAKSALFPNKKKKRRPERAAEDSRMRCRREHQEMLGRFTMTFGTRRPSQLVPDYNEEDDGTGGVSPRTSCRGSFDDDYLRRADLERH